MGQKSAESSDPGKYKARGVMAGNNIQSKNSPIAELFQDVTTTPASLVQVRTALAAGAVKGQSATVRDATSAYLQAPMREFNADGSRKPSQWLRLPKACWPKSWFQAGGVTPRYHDPVVRLHKAIYGHPESEAAWDEYLAKHLRKSGWLPASGQSSCFYHAACLRHTFSRVRR